jgi:integrase
MARGSITPRPTKDGKVRYRVKWESRGPDGKRKHHSETLKTKKAAEAFLAEKLDEVEKGAFVVASKESVGAFMERWLTAITPRLEEGTVYGYRSTIRNRITPHLGHIPLQRLDELTIQEAYATLESKGYKPSTIVEAHALLDSALTQAVAWRLITRNPADGVITPAVKTPAPTVWTAGEAAMVLAKADERKDRYAPIWRLGLDSGMRLGEMLALSWQDVAFERGVISVRRTLARTATGGWRISDHAKTSSSRRSIVVLPETLKALRRHKVAQAERRLSTGASWRDLGLVFDRGDGSWFNPATVQYAFEAARKHAGVSRITPHGMRHTMATLLLAAGVHPKIVQERLGHKTVKMTLDRYSHVTMTMQQDAALVLQTIMEKAHEALSLDEPAGDGNQARPNRGHETG